MIETVRQRQQNAVNFKNCYENLCALQGSCPMSVVTANLGDEAVDLNADRITLQDWDPILNATKINKNLKTIAVRSYWQEKMDPRESDSSCGQIYRKKTPHIRSKELTYKLCRALKECLCLTEALEVLIFQNIPLRQRDLKCFSKGISCNKTLKHLSFENCQIGDCGLEVLSMAIRNCFSLQSLNLTGCCITWHGAEILAKIIKNQATKKWGLAWQDSLRYRVPDLDRMSGLRRITLCKNSLLGDKGVEVLTEALKDDLWLKALDLQQCGISNKGALAFQSLLRCNKSLVVVDVRINPLIERELVTAITQHVIANSGHGETEYPWLRIKRTDSPATRTKKNKRRKSKNGLSREGSSKYKKSYLSSNRSRTYGIPWRTAERVGPNRHKKNETWPFAYLQDKHDVMDKCNNNNNNAEEKPPESDDELFDLAEQTCGFLSERVRQLEIEVEFLKHCLEEENQRRLQQSEMVLKLQLENRGLQREIELLRAVGTKPGNDHSHNLAPTEQHQLSRNDLLDDNVLESIEASFKQFHAFLDMFNGSELQDMQNLLHEMRLEKEGNEIHHAGKRSQTSI